MTRRFCNRIPRLLRICAAFAILTAAGTGCAPKEASPATPPSLPPVPPRPANQGASAQRYQQLMQQQGAKGAPVNNSAGTR